MNTEVINNNLLKEIRSLVINSKHAISNSVNYSIIRTFWNVGRLIVEYEQKGLNRAKYGKKQIQILALKLKVEFGNSFDERNLWYMRKFYICYPILNSLRSELSWTHYRTLINIENTNTRQWYENEAINCSWSTRALQRQLSTLYYERLLASKDKSPVIKEAEERTTKLNIKNYLRDPYVLEFLDLPSTSILESTVEKALINNLQKFLLELGRGFAFVSRQQRLGVEDQDFYVDLVFYNYKLKCFLLVDIKLGKLTHQDVGQMDTYVRIYDEHIKEKDDNPTIGLILCSEKSKAIAKYSILKESKQIFAAKYLLYLPTEEELRKELERELVAIDNIPKGDE